MSTPFHKKYDLFQFLIIFLIFLCYLIWYNSPLLSKTLSIAF
nr:MAG TPA: hypothetical protein [Caudoviricetes sp.]